MTTRFWNEYAFSATEKDIQIQRLNQYPKSQARLAYLLEVLKPVQATNNPTLEVVIYTNSLMN
jgi:hypothetical protein